MSLLNLLFKFTEMALINNVVRNNVVENDMDYKLIKCPDCLGTGYDLLDGGQCGRCGGLGVIEEL